MHNCHLAEAVLHLNEPLDKTPQIIASAIRHRRNATQSAPRFWSALSHPPLKAGKTALGDGEFIFPALKIKSHTPSYRNTQQHSRRNAKFNAVLCFAKRDMAPHLLQSPVSHAHILTVKLISITMFETLMIEL